MSAVTEMELRVAKALHDHHYPGEAMQAVVRPTWDGANKYERAYRIHQARTVIQAMREPTEEMYDAGIAEIDHIDGHLGVAFTAMIDTASPPDRT